MKKESQYRLNISVDVALENLEDPKAWLEFLDHPIKNLVNHIEYVTRFVNGEAFGRMSFTPKYPTESPMGSEDMADYSFATSVDAINMFRYQDDTDGERKYMLLNKFGPDMWDAVAEEDIDTGE